jgi:hypothetical protein
MADLKDGWEALRDALADDPCFALVSESGRHFILERFHGRGSTADLVLDPEDATALIAERRSGHIQVYHSDDRGH